LNFLEFYNIKNSSIFTAVLLSAENREKTCRPERGPEIPEILKSVLKCPEIH